MNITFIRVGCDIVNIPRFQKILTRTPATRKRLFLPREEKDASFERLAGIFAAKEAVIKALGLKAGDWKKIEVIKKINGRPEVKLLKFSAEGGSAIRLSSPSKSSGGNKKIVSRDISISHDGDYAMAAAIFMLEQNSSYDQTI